MKTPIYQLPAPSSRDTIQSKGRTGEPSRQLGSAWTQAWEDADIDAVDGAHRITGDQP
jgi:hypothetical protein